MTFKGTKIALPNIRVTNLQGKKNVGTRKYKEYALQVLQ